MQGTTGKALLIVAIDAPAELDEEPNRWYNEEHLADELRRVSGVLSARRYVASTPLQQEIFGHMPSPAYYPQYLTIFELETDEVLQGAEYLAFMNNPTEWSQRIVPNVRLSALVYHQIYPEEGFFTR